MIKSKPLLKASPNIEGWVIVHPNGSHEVDYFGITRFRTKLDDYKSVVTPEFWRKRYRPDCILKRMKLIDI